MKRKLVQQGPTTLMVSLPSQWIKQNNLKKGNDVDIEQEKDSLMIYAKAPETKYETVNIDLSELPRLTERIITSHFNKGTDEIHIKFPNSNTFNKIQKAMDFIVGFEIIEQKENSCILKSISTFSMDDFDKMVRRVFFMLFDMSDSLLDALKKKEYQRLEKIALLEETNNKFTNFCKRLLNKNIYKDQKTTNVMYVIVRYLEKLADEYKYICQHAKKGKVVDKEVISLLENTNKYIRQFSNLLYKGNLKDIQDFVLTRDKLIPQCKLLLKKNKNTVITHSLMNIIQTTFHMVSEIFLLNL